MARSSALTTMGPPIRFKHVYLKVTWPIIFSNEIRFPTLITLFSFPSNEISLCAYISGTVPRIFLCKLEEVLADVHTCAETHTHTDL